MLPNSSNLCIIFSCPFRLFQKRNSEHSRILTSHQPLKPPVKLDKHLFNLNDSFLTFFGPCANLSKFQNLQHTSKPPVYLQTSLQNLEWSPLTLLQPSTPFKPQHPPSAFESCLQNPYSTPQTHLGLFDPLEPLFGDLETKFVTKVFSNPLFVLSCLFLYHKPYCPFGFEPPPFLLVVDIQKMEGTITGHSLLNNWMYGLNIQRTHLLSNCFGLTRDSLDLPAPTYYQISLLELPQKTVTDLPWLAINTSYLVVTPIPHLLWIPLIGLSPPFFFLCWLCLHFPPILWYLFWPFAFMYFCFACFSPFLSFLLLFHQQERLLQQVCLRSYHTSFFLFIPFSQ